MSLTVRVLLLLAPLALAACGSDSNPAPAGTRTLGGSVSGLTGSVGLANIGGDTLTLSSNGGFVFGKLLSDTANYDVTVTAQPAGQTCVVSNGSGNMNAANVTSVVVNCTVNGGVSSHFVGGNVSGLIGSVVLRNNNADPLTLTGDGGFTFPVAVNEGGHYSVTVDTQPAGQTCTVSNGNSTVGSSDVADVTVTCASALYKVGGTVSGLVGGVTRPLILQNNGGDDIALSADGTFEFLTPVAHGDTYTVTVLDKPAAQTCAVTRGSNTITGHVSNVLVTCYATTYPVGGTISGLSGTLRLRNNLVQEITRNANGSYSFPTLQTWDSPYSVEVSTQPAGQQCTLSNASGTVQAAVTDIDVSCVNLSYHVTVTVFGLDGSDAATGTLTLQNGGDNLDVTSDGTISFATPVAHDGTWNVTMLSVPDDRVCNIFSATGTVVASDPQVYVACTGTAPATAVPGLDTVERPRELRFIWSSAFGASFYQLQKSPDNGTTWNQVGADIPDTPAGNFASDMLSLHLQDWAQLRYRLLSCNKFGCSAPSTAIPVISRVPDLTGYFKSAISDANDQIGSSIALSADGNTLAIGAPCEGSQGNLPSDNSMPCAGAVYVFHRDPDGDWTQAAWLKSSSPDRDDLFGGAIALSADGQTLAVGAIGEASAINGDTTDNSAPAAGAVFVFARSGDNWATQAYLKASNAQAQDLFGGAIALSADGNTLAVGATGEDSDATGIDGNHADNSQNDAGAVYLFTRDVASWAREAYIKASNTYQQDRFGTAIALSADGNRLAVGAPGEDSDAIGVNGSETDSSAFVDSGAVYLFRRSGGWSQEAYVKASNTGYLDMFGGAVAFSGDGNRLAVGTISEDSSATGVNGSETNDSATTSGAVYLFDWNSVAWSQQAYLKASNAESNDQFGEALAFSGDGNLLAVSAIGEAGAGVGLVADANNNGASGAGAVYLYRLDGGIWSSYRYVKASNTDANDHFGRSLALSQDGSLLAVGAEGEDSIARDVTTSSSVTRGDNSAPQTGVVYLY